MQQGSYGENIMSLRFLLDENVLLSVKKFLESKGYHAVYVPKGAKDSEVAKIAKNTNSILLTRDSDFANTLMYPPHEFPGIILLKTHPPVPKDMIESLEFVLENLKEEFKGKLIIATKEGFKVIEV